MFGFKIANLFLRHRPLAKAIFKKLPRNPEIPESVCVASIALFRTNSYCASNGLVSFGEVTATSPRGGGVQAFARRGGGHMSLAMMRDKPSGIAKSYGVDSIPMFICIRWD